MMDNAGDRIRQYRRIGLRTGYTEINYLPGLQWGCDEPCLSGFDLLRLHQWYNEFRSFSKQLKPCQKENRYILNIMFYPLLNSTVNVCSKALSNLFTVSEHVISDIRGFLQKIISDASLNTGPILETRERGYRYTPSHPMNSTPIQYERKWKRISV